MGIQHYSVFIVTGILLNVVPGSDTIYILSRTITQGKRAGIISLLGIILGALVHTLLAGLGLSIILMKSALVFAIVKWIGAGYLVYLGIKSLMTKTNQTKIEEQAHAYFRKIFMQGFLTNLLNPKVALFFLAFLPQFVSQDNQFGSLPLFILGFTFIATGTVWCLILVLLSDIMTKSIRRSRIASYLNKITGVVFILLGLNLLRANRGN
jgi:RhtB (resistance to homoserine/threonine) family protein